MRAQKGDILYHPDIGLTYRGMASFERLKEIEKQEEISEAKRLLYVAVTRAEERLYWCARDGKTAKDSWWSWLQAALEWLPGDLIGRCRGPCPLEGKALRQNLCNRSFRLCAAYAPIQSGFFSVTSLMSYARCPRYYYLRYILGVPERKPVRVQAGSGGAGAPLSGTQRGNIVHRVVEQIKDPRMLSELVEHAAAMEGVVLDNRQKSGLEEVITAYLNSEFFSRVRQEQGRGKIFQEHDFIIPAGDFYVNGLVDHVYLGEGGIEIVDFKSNWITHDQVTQVGAGYDVQLRLYAWAMAREFGLPVISSQAYFLIPNRLYGLEARLLDADQTEEWLIKTCTDIIQGSEQGAAVFPSGATVPLPPECILQNL